MKAILGKLNNELLLNLASRAASFCSEVDVAVAYAESKDHPLLQTCREKGLRVRFYGLLDEEGAVSPALLRELLAWGPSRAEARLLKGHFHPKVIWWRGFGAYIGSANLTHKAWFRNVEAGVFFDEAELMTNGSGAELDLMFDHLAKNSIPVTTELVEKLEKLAQERRVSVDPQRGKLRSKFDQMFGHLPDNAALTVSPPKGQKENKAQKRFAVEWMRTLQLMRGLAKEFAALGLKPVWVDRDAHSAVHFDQFLHAYYYDYVRGGTDADDDELSGLGKVEASFARNATKKEFALKEAAKWWASLPADRYGEELFIRETAPATQRRLSAESLKKMDLGSFREAVRCVNAFRMHARQVKNVELGLPANHHETVDQRVDRLCEWLWNQRTSAGKTVRDVLEFVLWASTPSDMEQRLWLGVWGQDYRLPHFGQSTLGEAVGWARPDDYPPRNNRTNKALRALGHDVKLFGSG